MYCKERERREKGVSTLQGERQEGEEEGEGEGGGSELGAASLDQVPK